MTKLLLSFFLILTTIFGLNASEVSKDDLADLYHERIEQRYLHIEFESFSRISESEIPNQVQELRQKQLDDLNHFARTYDLYRIGWSYQNHPNVTEVTIQGGEVVVYTFSILILKNDVPRSRRFYQATKRVDGVFFVERVSDYDIK